MYGTESNVPINITQGNTAEFVVEFLDASGNLGTITGGTIVISYTSASTLSLTSQTIVLVPNGNFFTGSWDSSVAAPGLAPWNVFITGSSTAVKSDIVRVID